MSDAAPAAPGAERRGGLLRFSIRGKIALAFVSIALVVGAIGWFAAWSMAQLGGMLIETYDKPLQSISFARAIHADFASMEAAFARRTAEKSPDIRVKLDAEIDVWAKTLTEDLSVVEERAASARVRESVAKVAGAIEAWQQARAAMAAEGAREPDWSVVDRSAGVVRDQIDLLVNYAAGDGFRQRKQTQQAINENRAVQIAGAVAAALLAAIVMFSLSRRIVRPLAAASRAASSIAQGDLSTPIPISGRDELAAMLSALSVMRDRIRETVEQERSQRRSAQTRLVDAIESSSEGIILLDGDGRVLLSNAVIDTLTGTDGVAPPGEPIHLVAERLAGGAAFKAATPAETSRLRDDLSRMEPADLEAELADGRWVRLSRSRSSDGGAILIFSDISLMKERETVLRDAAVRAEAASRAKTEFLAKMSHELRTPLNSIIGFSELISGEAVGPLGHPQYKDFAADIVSGGRALLGIINDILMLVKSETGDLSINCDDVDLEELIEESVFKVSALFAKAQVTLEVAAGDTELVAYGDRARLRHVLVNLLSNAAKFTPAGGVARVSAARIADGRVRMSVCDTGIGMRPEDIDVALSAFGQLDSSLARRFEGAGLGLTISKLLVDLHGGELAVDSTPGAGTTVSVTLPAADRGSRAKAA